MIRYIITFFAVVVSLTACSNKDKQSSKINNSSAAVAAATDTLTSNSGIGSISKSESASVSGTKIPTMPTTTDTSITPSTQTDTQQSTFLPAEHLPAELTQIIASNREAVFKQADPNALDTVRSYQTTGLNPETDAKIAALLQQAQNDTNIGIPKTITREQALNELNFLFDLLKYGYGSYTYFGGDDTFGALKQYMTVRISTMGDPVSTDDYLNDFLAPCLRTLIIDNHFWVGGVSIGSGSRNFYSTEHLFIKDGDSYTTVIDGKEYKLVDDQSAQYLLPTLDQYGKIAWTLGIMSNINYSNIGAKLEDMQTKEIVQETWPVSVASKDYINYLSKDIYTLDDDNDYHVPILTNRLLWAPQTGDESKLNDFVKTGLTLRDDKLLIVDLRNNGGGNDVNAYQWLVNYTSSIPQYSFFFNTCLVSKTSKAFFTNGNVGFPMRDSNWSDIVKNPPLHLSNKNLVIVLMDNHISSAGETFIGYLRQMDNVIFVGVPTEGCLTSGNVGGTVLPDSKYSINFGINLNIRPDLSKFEGEGFSPDLWVSPSESLDRVLKFIQQLY